MEEIFFKKFLCKVEELNFSFRVYILRLDEYIINDSSMKLFVYHLTENFRIYHPIIFSYLHFDIDKS